MNQSLTHAARSPHSVLGFVQRLFAPRTGRLMRGTPVLVFLMALLTLQDASAQLAAIYDFNANSTGWTGNITRTTALTACGSASMRRNLYASVTTGNMVSPSIPGTNSSGLVTVTYKYKAANWSANTVGTNPWGSFNVQYGSTATGPWTTFATVSQEVQNGACITKTHTFTPPAGAVFIKWDCFWTNGDYYINFDDINISQAAGSPCVGTPAPGNTIASVNPVCPGTNNTILTLQNATAGSGVTYQWQSSPDNVTYSNIAAATAASYTASVGTATWYRCNVTCSGNTGTSNPLQITTNAFTNCYCAAIANNAGDTEILNVTLGALNNTSNCTVAATGAGSVLQKYANYRNLPPVTIDKIVPISLSVTPGTCGGEFQKSFRVFIDGNQDGDFIDAGEAVYTSAVVSTSAPVAATINIPATFLDGITGMRVVLLETTAPAGIVPCGTFGNWGEVEDYLINLNTPPVCNTVPASNTLSSSPNVCSGASFTLSLSNSYAAAGYTFQWQSSPDNVTWTNVAGATNATLATSQTSSTWYRCNVACLYGGTPITSTALQVTMAPVYNCYCASNATSTADEDITNVTIGSLNNSSACGAVGGAGSVAYTYQNYRGVTAPNFAQSSNQSVSIAITGCNGTMYASGARVFIDYNQDGDFADAGENVFTSAGQTVNGGAVTQSLTGNFLIPCTALTGLTGMRVVAVETTPTSITPCGTYTWGETEDYLVNITAPAACAGAPPSSNTISSVATACPSTNINLSLDASYASCDYSLQWERSFDNVTYSNIPGAITAVQAVTGQLAATYYRCVITCIPSGLTTTSTEILVGQNALFDCYCASGASIAADGEVVGVTVGTINQSSTCGTTAPGAGSVSSLYSNYKAVQTTLTKTELNSMSVSIRGCGTTAYNYITKVWIDYNKDATFQDATELIYTSPITSAPVGGGSAPLNFTFTVPLTATDGLTLMRVVAWETTVASTVTACGTYGYGETEDYTINIVSPPSCNGTPTPGTLPSTLAILNNTSAVLQPVGLGIELNNVYQWEESDDNGGADPWSNVVGGSGDVTTTYTTANLTSTRWYRLRVECTTTSSVAYTNAIQLQVVGGASCADPYIVAALPFSLNFSANGAGNDIGLQTSTCSNVYGGGQDVVFQFTAPAAGNYEISVVNTSNTRNIGWFLKSGTDCNLTTLASQLACNVSTATYNSAHNVVAIPSAGTYYVIVDYAAPVTQSNFFIRIRQTPSAPANDNCATATVLTQGATNTCAAPSAGTLAGASASGVPVICTGGAVADDDVWYSFVATSEAALIDVQTTTNGVVESGANLAWEAFSGTCGGLTPLFCRNASTSRGVNENATVVGLTVGQTYYLRIYDFNSGYGSAGGNFSVCVYTPAPPSNNDCSGATVLAVGASCVTTSGNTVAATQSLAAVACNGFTGNADDDVWYEFTIAAPADITIDVAATGTLFDPVVQLFSGSCGAPTSITCADNSLRGGVERITRSLAAGTYFVRLYHYGTGTGGGGSHTICVRSGAFPAAAPINDNTCTALELPLGNACSPEGPFVSQTATRTLRLSVAQGGDGDASDDLWFKFSPLGGQSSVSIAVQGGGGYDAVFQVYEFSNCKTLTALFPPVDFTAANGIEEQTVFGLLPATTYYIRVFDWNAAAPAGNFTICAYVTPPPPNDAFANAELLYQQNSASCFAPTFGYTVSGSGGDASSPCGGVADDNVWYTFVATNTTATITVTGTQGFDPIVDFRGGAGVGTSIQCANATGADGTETISATGLTIGQTYKIQVFGGGTNPAGWGTFDICVYGVAAPPVNDNCPGAIGLPNASPCATIAGILTGATQSTPETCTFVGTAYDVWYSFIASSPQATITPIGAAGATDMAVQIYSGTCAALTSVGCADNDPAPGTENLVVNGLTPGQTYYTRVYAVSGTAPATSGGPNPNFTICYTGVPPINDNICGATNVNVSSGIVNITTNNLGATNTTTISPTMPNGAFTSWNNDVWFKCTVPTNGVVAINVVGIGFNDPKLRAYTSSDNTCSGTLTAVAWDDDGGATFGSFAYISGLTPGNILYFAVDGFSAANFGQFRMNVNDGWVWTGTTGFGYSSAGTWINQSTTDANPNPFTAVTLAGSTGWSSTPATTVISIPAVANQPIVTANASIGGIKFVGSVLTQSKITVNSGNILTLNGTTFAGTGRGLTGVGAGGRVEGAGRLDIGAAVSGQTITVNTPTRFRLATTVLGTANVQSNGNMIFDNSSSLYSGQAGPNSLVNGNITYRRQGNTSQVVYNFWSSPLTNGTLASLAAPGFVPNLYQYNTATATGLDYLGTQAGWQALTPSTSMTPGKGYIATGAGLANFTGLPQQGTSINLAGQVGGGGNNFNLIGNPYPAPISANSFLTSNAASISGGAIYIWDDDISGGTAYDAGDFIIYNGVGTVNGVNSGAPFSGNIASCQGFFVNYSGAGSFNFTSAMKVYGTNSEFFDISTANRLRLRMENSNGVGTEALVAFIDDATEGVDNSYDALRLQGNADLSLYTFNGDLEYAIQAWPTLTNERVIDLGAINTVTGASTISMNLFENFDPTTVVYLEDTELGIFHNLTQNGTYAFDNSGLNGDAVRFRLHFRAPVGVSSVMDCSGTESGKILVGNPNSTPIAVELKNANNEVVATAAPFVGEHEFVNLASGNYTLGMSYTDGGNISRNIVVENNGMTTPASFIASATNVSIADAIIEFQGNAQGATEYTWDFGDGTVVSGDLNPVHAYNALGVYTVTFTAMNNGCGSSATTAITVGADLTGTNNVATTSGFSIFPNPAANVANLLLNLDRTESSVTVSIHDAAGRLVSTNEVNNVRSGAVVGLEVETLSNGVYQVTVEGTNFKNVGRLTIAK